VTCCSYDRHPCFGRHDAVALVRTQILRTCAEYRFAELASVFMPDHLHLLLEGEDDGAAFVPLMKTARQRSAVAYRRLTGRRLWQDGYFEHVLRADQDTRTVIEYIVGNPIRAGLVNRPHDYPYVWSTYGFDVAL